MKSLSFAAVVAAAVLGGCSESRSAVATDVIIDECLVGVDGSLFLRYDATAAPGSEGRWLRGSTPAPRGWLEFAPPRPASPPDEDPVLADPVWAAALVHDDTHGEWRPYPMVAMTAAVGVVRPEALAVRIEPNAAPTAWESARDTRLPADSNAATSRLARCASIDWPFVIALPRDQEVHPITWLHGDAPCASSSADALLARIVVRDGWRTEAWLRIPVALLADDLELAREGDGIIGTRRVVWVARFAQASGQVRPLRSPGPPLKVASQAGLHGSDDEIEVPTVADVARSFTGAANDAIAVGAAVAAGACAARALLEPFVLLASATSHHR